MWQVDVAALVVGRVYRLVLHDAQGPMSWRTVAQLWQTPSFAEAFSQTLASVPFPAFFLETPAARSTELDTDFECVVIQSLALRDVVPNPESFAGLLDHADDGACVTYDAPDLSLVVPCGAVDARAHLAAYVRLADAQAQHALWREVGATLLDRVHNGPVWLSTAGPVVPWLHIRLDSQPRYHQWEAYREQP